MQKLRSLWRSVFDIRPGEYLRTLLVAAYLMFVLFAYYIIKPASISLFLNRFSITQLPYLTILTAGVGGVLAYLYTRVMVRASLGTAVAVTSFGSIAILLSVWWLLRFELPWMIYVFNIWVNLFSIVLVSQGWIIAANVFTPREAKRLYSFLGLGAVAGAAFGGKFTAILADDYGTENLLPWSAVMVFLSYVAYAVVARAQGAPRAEKTGEASVENFAFRDIALAITRHRHLQVIIGIITITFVVNEIVDFQFSAFAKQSFKGDQLTQFLGDFFGLYLNLLSFFLQIFITAFVVDRFGVGGTLQIMPVVMLCSALTMLLAPGITAMSVARLAEASTRYSINRTGMELLYLPLPLELKNRTKAFVDIFADRMARALGGVILAVFTIVAVVPVRYLSVLTIGLTVIWMVLAMRAKREYVATVRERLKSRRLDLTTTGLSVEDPATLRMLEETASSDIPRQASYALGLLSEAGHYRLEPLLHRLSHSPHAEVRAKVYELARERRYPPLLKTALTELRNARRADVHPALSCAAQYALAVTDDVKELTKRLLDHSHPEVVKGVIESLSRQPELATDLLTTDWLTQAAQSPDPARRALAAMAVRARGDQGTEVLHRLLKDDSPVVLSEAFRAAGALQNRAYLGPLIQNLTNARLRGVVIDSLTAYGARIIGTLGDLLSDASVPMKIRRQVPRVLRRIADQRVVDILMAHVTEPDLTLRTAVLRALSRLRETAPQLNYGTDPLTQHVHDEARYYYEMNASLAAFREQPTCPPMIRLLSRTLEERLKGSLERVFRLIGLRYPPKEIYAAYRATVERREGEDYSAALEFLDTVLERELKRFLLPLLDDNVQVARSGQELFGVEVRDVRAALRELIRSGDSWLVSCAVATAAELKLHELRDEIAPLSERAGTEVGQVAQAALVEMG